MRSTRVTPVLLLLLLMFFPTLLFADDLGPDHDLSSRSLTEDLATISSSGNTTLGNVTCGEDQEFCEDTQSCSRPGYQCNGCHTTSVKCPDGQCVPLPFYIMQGCSHCHVWEYECPDGHCYDRSFSSAICPPCDLAQKTCPDRSCVPTDGNCTRCPAGKKRCADMDCISESEQCGKPCFSDQVYCSFEGVCRDDYADCKCDLYNEVPCTDGSCRYETCESKSDSRWPIDPINTIGFVACVLVVPCAILSRKYYRQRKLRELLTNMHSMEMQPREETAVSQYRATNDPHLQPPDIQTPLLEPSSPPSYETATMPPPPPYSEVDGAQGEFHIGQGQGQNVVDLGQIRSDVNLINT